MCNGPNNLNNFERGPTKDHSCEVWSNPNSSLGEDVIWRNCLRTHGWMDAWRTTDKMWSQKLTLSLCDMWAKNRKIYVKAYFGFGFLKNFCVVLFLAVGLNFFFGGEIMTASDEGNSVSTFSASWPISSTWSPSSLLPAFTFDFVSFFIVLIFWLLESVLEENISSASKRGEIMSSESLSITISGFLFFPFSFGDSTSTPLFLAAAAEDALPRWRDAWRISSPSFAPIGLRMKVKLVPFRGLSYLLTVREKKRNSF